MSLFLVTITNPNGVLADSIGADDPHEVAEVMRGWRDQVLVYGYTLSVTRDRRIGQ